MPILPSLGLLFIIILGYFIFKQKVNDYNEKFTSMFSLLSAMTDEINKLKLFIKMQHFKPIEVDNLVTNDSDDYDEDEDDEDDDYEDENDNDDDEDENDNDADDDEDDDDDDDEEDDDDDNDDEDNKEENNDKEEEEEEDTTISNNIVEELEEKEIIIQPTIDYNNMTTKELRNLAKEKGLSGENLSKLKKNELISLLENKTMKIE